MQKILLIFLLLSGNCGVVKQPQNTEYIEIRHDGIEQYLIKPVFLSVQSITIEIDGNYAIINHQKPVALSDREKFILSEAAYNNLLVDEHTVKKISDFIGQFPFFLKNNSENDDVNYSIVSKNGIHKISYKGTRAFFADLISFLKNQKCSQNDIQKLENYLKNNLVAPL